MFATSNSLQDVFEQCQREAALTWAAVITGRLAPLESGVTVQGFASDIVEASFRRYELLFPSSVRRANAALRACNSNVYLQRYGDDVESGFTTAPNAASSTSLKPCRQPQAATWMSFLHTYHKLCQSSPALVPMQPSNHPYEVVLHIQLVVAILGVAVCFAVPRLGHFM